MKLPKRQKYALFGVFGLAFFICFISVLRLIYLIPFVNNPPVDWFYDGVPLDCWTVVEINGAIVVACTMTLKPLIGKFFPHLLSSLGSGNNNNNNDYYEGKGNWIAPPTIGSKPSKDILGGSGGGGGRLRNSASLEELGYYPDGPTANGLELDEASSSPTSTSNKVGSPMEQQQPDTRAVNHLRPPPKAHQKALSSTKILSMSRQHPRSHLERAMSGQSQPWL